MRARACEIQIFHTPAGNRTKEPVFLRIYVIQKLPCRPSLAVPSAPCSPSACSPSRVRPLSFTRRPRAPDW